MNEKLEQPVEENKGGATDPHNTTHHIYILFQSAFWIVGLNRTMSISECNKVTCSGQLTYG